MHSLILSSSQGIRPLKLLESNPYEDIYGDAAESYIESNGFNSRVIMSVVPKISEVDIPGAPEINASAYLMNGKVRVVSRGEAVEVLKRCSFVIINSRIMKVTRKIARSTMQAIEQMLSKGLQVYALAIKDMSLKSDRFKNMDRFQRDYALVALVGI